MPKPKSKSNTNEVMIELQDLSTLSTKVNETLNYMNEYKKQGIKANANDMMVLYKIVSDYEKKMGDFLRNPGEVGGYNNTAKYIDLIGRHADAELNKRTIAKAIVKSMEEIRLDTKDFTNRLNEKLTDKERKGKETKELLNALSNYASLSNGSEENEYKVKGKADAKQRLVDACVAYVKNGDNKEVKKIVYDIAAVMGKQNMAAFDKLKDKDLSEMSVRRHIGFQSNVGGKNPFGTHYLGNHIAPAEFIRAEKDDILDKLGPDSKLTQEEKDAAYDKYISDLFAKDKFARFTEEEHKQAEKELGKDATEEEKQQKLGEIAYRNAPWNKIKLDDTTKSKEAFVQRQKVMRQWFPDDSRLLFGATREKNIARDFHDILDNSEYNGFVRSMKNSDEYKAVLETLKTFADGKDANEAKDEKNLKAVKDACEKYLERYEKKKDKSEFATKRAEKVKELVKALSGEEKDISKDAEKKDRSNTKKTNVKELEGSKKSAGKTSKQSNSKTKNKDLGKSKR